MENSNEEKGIIVVPEHVKSKVKNNDTVTPYEQCLLDHESECGSCDKNTGNFLEC